MAYQQTITFDSTVMLMAVRGHGVASQAATAHNEKMQLKAVYDNWTDGGNTDGLEAFVSNPANDSYHVRNQLMLVAPKVSSEVWQLVFERVSTMNPWHMAQALIANSPLEPEVYKMMEASSLTQFYKQLVTDQQSGGINMQTIMESEMAYWLAEQSKAQMVHSTLAYDSIVTYSNAIALHQQYPVPGSAEQVFLLRIANGDLTGARADVNTVLAGTHEVWWEVQDIYLGQLEAGQEMLALDPTQLNDLQLYATIDEHGASNAQAWLAATGTRPQAEVLLPGTSTKMFMGGQHQAIDIPSNFLGVYPNPTAGEAYITYELPQGASTGQLLVQDALGRTVMAESLVAASGIVELSGVLIAGTYVIVLEVDGVKLSTKKLISTR